MSESERIREILSHAGGPYCGNPYCDHALLSIEEAESAIAQMLREARLSQINKDRAVVLSYFTTGEQLKAFREDAEAIRALSKPEGGES